MGMTLSIPSIWFKVFTVYQKDPRLLSEWVSELKMDIHRALGIAKYLVEYDVVPEALILGFTPQVLVAICAVNSKPITIVTSPEVTSGTPPARYSYEVLEILREHGLIEKVIVTPLAPSETLTPVDIVNKLYKTLEEIDAETLDISGGTQLAAIAAMKTNKKITYTYPLGRKIKIYKLR